MFDHNQRWKDYLVEAYRLADAHEAGITSRVGLDLYMASRELDDICQQISDIASRIGDDRTMSLSEKVFMEGARLLEMAKQEPPFGGFVFHRDLLPGYLGEVAEEVYDGHDWFVKTNIDKGDGIIICGSEEDAYETLRWWRAEHGLDPVTGERR